MGYSTYKDANGITWNVHPPEGWTMHAYVPEDASPRYDPPAPDLESETPPPDPSGNPAGAGKPTGDQQRVIFASLTSQIEQYALQHRRSTMLVVKPDPPLPWWLWLAIAYVFTRKQR